VLGGKGKKRRKEGGRERAKGSRPANSPMEKGMEGAGGENHLTVRSLLLPAREKKEKENKGETSSL